MEFAIGWLVFAAAIFVVLIVLPQRRRLAAHRALLGALEVGDEVVTASGLYGCIRRLDDMLVRLEVAPDVIVRVARAAIVGRVEPSDDETPPDEPRLPGGL
jgi:preprotein translocase subunit YajC